MGVECDLCGQPVEPTGLHLAWWYDRDAQATVAAWVSHHPVASRRHPNIINDHMWQLDQRRPEGVSYLSAWADEVFFREGGVEAWADGYAVPGGIAARVAEKLAPLRALEGKPEPSERPYGQCWPWEPRAIWAIDEVRGRYL